jgi:hypothetical protein
VTNVSLAQSYLLKARSRLKILPVLLEEDAYSDVVREAQEIVELALKGMLRQVGVEPPKWHDVGSFLLEFADRFPALERDRLERGARPRPKGRGKADRRQVIPPKEAVRGDLPYEET